MTTVLELRELFAIKGLKRADLKFINDEAFKLLEDEKNLAELVKFYEDIWNINMATFNSPTKRFKLLSHFIEKGFDSDSILKDATLDEDMWTKLRVKQLRPLFEKLIARNPDNFFNFQKYYSFENLFDVKRAESLKPRLYELAKANRKTYPYAEIFIREYEKVLFNPTYHQLSTRSQFYIGAFLTACDTQNLQGLRLNRELSPTTRYDETIKTSLENENIIIKMGNSWKLNIKNPDIKTILNPNISRDDECLWLWKEMALEECVEYMFYYKQAYDVDNYIYAEERQLIQRMLHCYTPAHLCNIIRKALKEASASKLEHSMRSSAATKCFINNLARYHDYYQEGKWVYKFEEKRKWMQSAASEFLYKKFIKIDGHYSIPNGEWGRDINFDENEEESLH